MSRRTLTIDEKIERQKEIVTKAKEKYEEAVDELERLISSKDEIYKEEIMKAYEKSGRTYKEIIEFLKSKPAPK